MADVTITYLEMRSPAALRPRPSPDPCFAVREAIVPQWEVNRFLYFFVGGRWDWTDKQSWSFEQWRSYVEADTLRTFIATLEGSIAGYYELRRDAAHAVEIVYFGLTPSFIGRGFGGALLTDAIERAWAWDAERVWVHTCTRDHPAALKNYQARGMVIYDRKTHEVE